MWKILLITACVIAMSFTARAGDLEPGNPVAPTMKTLDQVEPRIPIPASSTPATAFVINSSGSYYLTGDRLASANGIEVNADNVTIDLMGYRLAGTGQGGAYGIYMDGRSNVTIRNGTIGNFGFHGIYEASKTSGRNHRILDVRLVGNTFSGVYLKGKKCVVKNCIAAENGDKGIYAYYRCTIVDNSVYANGGDGVYTYEGSVVKNNNIYENGGAGIYTLGDDNMIEGNHVTGGNSVGLRISGAGNYLADNTVRDNSDNYVIAADNQVNLLLCEVPDTIDFPCTVKFAGSLRSTGTGIEVDADDVIIDLAGHSLIGPGPDSGYTYGVYMNNRSNVTIRNGTIREFGRNGIREESYEGMGHKIESVRVRSNGNQGIYLRGDSHLVKDCSIETNGGDGIYIYGQHTRITGNTVYQNGNDGIYVYEFGVISGNTVYENLRKGIYAYRKCIVKENKVFLNEDIGLHAGQMSRLSGNTVYDNKEHGIQVSSYCKVVDNMCMRNGYRSDDVWDRFGINITGSENWVEANHVVDNHRGIYADLSFVVKNHAEANGVDYVVTGVGAGTVTPNAQTAGPWDNFR